MIVPQGYSELNFFLILARLSVGKRLAFNSLMIHLKKINRLAPVSLFLALSPMQSSALPRCTQGPECSQIQSKVAELKKERAQRHLDVQKYGRESEEVKADDQAITQLTAQDRELRSERKTDLTKTKSAGKKRKHPISRKQSAQKHRFT